MCLEIKTELNDEWAVEKQKEKCRKCVTFWTIFIVLSVLGEPVKKSKKKKLSTSFFSLYLFKAIMYNIHLQHKTKILGASSLKQWWRQSSHTLLKHSICYICFTEQISQTGATLYCLSLLYLIAALDSCGQNNTGIISNQRQLSAKSFQRWNKS